MPDNLLALDQHLPRFTGRETLENKVDQVARYEYELLEALRYVIYHLDTRNFNMTAINQWMGSVMDPFNARLEDAEGNITKIKVTAKGIETTVKNQQGDISQIRQTADKIQMTVQDQQKNISSIEQTAKSIQMTVQNQAGDIANLTVTADAIRSTVQNQQGDISAIQQTAVEIQSTVRNQQNDISQMRQTATEISQTVQSHTGEISQIRQTANAIQTTVANQNGEISAIRQTADSITQTVMDQTKEIGSMIEQTVGSIKLSVNNYEGYSSIQLTGNGITAEAQTIEFTGMVTFSDLSEEGRKTFINGANIITDTLMLDRLYGQEIYLYTDSGDVAATFYLDWASSFRGYKILLESGAIELSANPGDMHLSGGENPYKGEINISSGEVSVKGDLIPSSSDSYNCGTSWFPWLDIYSTDGTISSSDRAGKMDIDYDMSRYEGLFDRLRPCSFLRKHGTSGRRHHGFVAQDVEEALKAEGMTGMDFAGFVKWPDQEAGSGYGIRYEEIIAMLVHEVQELKRAKKGVPGEAQP